VRSSSTPVFGVKQIAGIFGGREIRTNLLVSSLLTETFIEPSSEEDLRP